MMSPSGYRSACLSLLLAAAVAERLSSAASSSSPSSSAAAVAPASVVGATHWSPCYFVSALPSLWDGCAALARTGTRVAKLILDGSPDETYPWNTDWEPIMKNVSTLAQLAATELYDAALRGRATPAPAWSFDTYLLVTYSLSAGAGDWNYWCDAFTPSNAADETAEFAGLTTHLLSAFAGTGKSFYLEHWEGDWSARCGGYDAQKPADPAVQARMVQWLAARQAGVEAGRAAWCHRGEGRAAGLDCAAAARDPRALHAAAGAAVFHGTEVNLVWDSMQTGFPDNILEVVPKVALDFVSYSSYDSMFRAPGFGDALDFIAAHHVPTAASPSPAVIVAEYGVAQQEEPVEALLAIYRNVAAYTFSESPAAPGVRRAAFSLAWELFDNEVDSSSTFPGGRCNSKTGPEFNESLLHGFWLIRPDGSLSPSFDFLAGLINGSVPVPPLPAPGSCSYTSDEDVDGGGGAPDAPFANSTREQCCARCQADMRCTSAVLGADGKCWPKYGGTPVAKSGATRCVPPPPPPARDVTGAAGREDLRYPVRPFPSRAFRRRERNGRARTASGSA